MTTPGRAQHLLAAAVGFGFLGERLLHGPGLGLNLTLLVVAWLGAWLLLARGAEVPAPRWTVVPLVLCAAGFAWRDDPALWMFDWLGIGVGLGLMALPALRRERSLGHAGVGALSLSGGQTALAFAAGALPAFADALRADPGQVRRPGREMLVATARGLVLAAPPLLVFGALLMSADARFDRLISSFIAVKFEELVERAVVVGFVAWTGAGLLWNAFRPVGPAMPARMLPTGTVGAVEVAVIAGLIDVLFLGFVAVQGSYLFGGDKLIASQADLSYAEYARRGFFQLVVVAGLSLPVLLGLARVAAAGTGSRLFRPLAGLQIALLFLILASASHRLLLYVSQFGLTLDRLEAAAVLTWIATTLLWFAATVLRGRAERFLPGGLAAAAIILATLHLVNPAAVVVKVNLGRASAGVPLDVHYLADLGADGVPALVAALPDLPRSDRGVAAQLLCARPQFDEQPLAWNYGRARAAAAMKGLRGNGCGFGS